MEQQTTVRRCSHMDPFDDVNANSEVNEKATQAEKKTRSFDFVFQMNKEKVYYCPIFSDICMDLSRRLPHYLPDYYDSKTCQADVRI